MRHNIPHVSAGDSLPECPECGTPTVFTHTADLARDGRVYFIFKCDACPAGESKFWRAEWQALADTLAADE